MNQILGELESKVMKVVWDKCSCSAQDVLVALESDKKYAYTTIGTILDRLRQKGLLTRKRQGRFFSYKPTISQEEFTERITRDVLAGLLKDEERPILSTFVDLLSDNKELLKELKDLLKRKS
jgi:predicted transcriptional regulator